MHVFVAIWKLIIVCIFCIDVNTLPVDRSSKSIDTAKCSLSLDTAEDDHPGVRLLDNVNVRELLESVSKTKEQNGQSKVSDKYIIDSFIANTNNQGFGDVDNSHILRFLFYIMFR